MVPALIRASKWGCAVATPSNPTVAQALPTAWAGRASVRAATGHALATSHSQADAWAVQVAAERFLRGKPFAVAQVRSAWFRCVTRAIGLCIPADYTVTPQGTHNCSPALHRERSCSVQIPGCGRGLVATDAIAAGARLFLEQPLTAAPHARLRAHLCMHCLSVAGDVAVSPSRAQATAGWGAVPATPDDDAGADLTSLLALSDTALPAQSEVALCADCTAADTANANAHAFGETAAADACNDACEHGTPSTAHAWLQVFRTLDAMAVARLRAWCDTAGQALPLLTLRAACARVAERELGGGRAAARGDGVCCVSNFCSVLYLPVHKRTAKLPCLILHVALASIASMTLHTTTSLSVFEAVAATQAARPCLRRSWDTLCYVRLPSEEAHPTTLDLRASHALFSACFSGHATPDAQLFSGWEWYRGRASAPPDQPLPLRHPAAAAPRRVAPRLTRGRVRCGSVRVRQSVQPQLRAERGGELAAR